MPHELPQEFLDRMKNDLGDQMEAFLASYERPLRPSLRVNRLKISSEAFRKAYGERFHLTPVTWEEAGFYYDEETRPGRSALHEAGVFYIQEASAMIVGTVSGVRPGEKVLDLCAAPGGKSTHLAMKMQGQGILVSNEIMPARARILSRNIERMGVTNAVVTNEAPADLADHFPAFFDRIIVDAPCSGEGMFRKEEAAIPNWSPQNVALCAGRQREILEAADRMLKPGGTLVYSTCTFARPEDEENVAWFMSEHSNYEEEDLPALLGDRLDQWRLSPGFDGRSLRVWPHKACGEGHFCARLRKSGGTLDLNSAGGKNAASSLHGQTFAAKNPESQTSVLSLKDLAAELDRESNSSAASRKKNRGGNFKKKRKGSSKGGSDRETQDLLNSFWTETFSAEFPEDLSSRLLTFGDDIFLAPFEHDAIDLSGLRVLRPGLHLGTMKKGRFEPAHALALAVLQTESKKDSGPFPTVFHVKNTVSLTADSPETLSYLRGESLACDQNLKGWTLVLADGFPLGWGKASSGTLKNHYPKGLRIQGGY